MILASLLFEGRSDDSEFTAGMAAACASFGLFTWLVQNKKPFYRGLVGIFLTIGLLYVAKDFPPNWQAVISMFAVLIAAAVQAYVTLRPHGAAPVRTVLNA